MSTTTKTRLAPKPSTARHPGGRPRVLPDGDPSRRPKADAITLRFAEGDRDLFARAQAVDERGSFNEWALWVLRSYSRDVTAKKRKTG